MNTYAQINRKTFNSFTKSAPHTLEQQYSNLSSQQDNQRKKGPWQGPNYACQ